jgi:hypothetical protein
MSALTASRLWCKRCQTYQAWRETVTGAIVCSACHKVLLRAARSA